MRDFTIGDLGVFIGTIGGVVTSILIVLQKSSCLKIKCCGFECIRDPALVKKHIKEKPVLKKKENRILQNQIWNRNLK